MDFLIVSGIVLLITVSVLGFLFFLLNQEGQKKEEEKIVPLTDLDQLRKEFSLGASELKAKGLVAERESVFPLQPQAVPASPVAAQSLAGATDAYKKRAEELEEELKTIAQKARGQSDEAKQMIETLTMENAQFKKQKIELDLLQVRLGDLEAESSSLKTENVNLQQQLDLSNTKVQQLEHEMMAVKLQMGDEISRANEVVVSLTRQKEELALVKQADPDQALRLEFEALKTEQAELMQKYEDLHRTYQKLHELNAHLIEKNDLMQYELIKARAQSSGLERINLNYKNQLEDFSRKVTVFSTSNEQLSDVKNRLEGMVEQIKLQNEDLLKKDQLSQFELSKSRLRLEDLEREYDDLKARVSRNDSK